ncbi:hypothetical protein [Paraburkholderia sp. JPY419]|uniref:hypothetical protein n=1 Tax=Paraburkholderia sp. JPY419 TaxID=667660 RepID=UPI003D19618C
MQHNSKRRAQANACSANRSEKCGERKHDDRRVRTKHGGRFVLDCERANAGLRTVRNVVRRARRLQLKLAEIDDFHHDFRNIRCQPHISALLSAPRFAL